MRSKNNKANNARRAKTAELNKRYRHEASELKRLGVLTKRVNAHKNITHATRTKINKFRDVLEGKASAVRAPLDIRRKYEGILEARGGVLVVPKEREKERVKIARGLVEIERPLPLGPQGLSYGSETEVILPFKPKDMRDLVNRLRDDPTLDNLKQPGELFAFRLDGWASKSVFVDAREMGDYIFARYQHLFKAGSSKQALKYLAFVRYRGPVGFGKKTIRDESGGENEMKMYKKGDRRNRSHPILVERKRAKDAARKAEARRQETPEVKAQRLATQKLRSAQNRQRKFEEK